MENGNVRRYKEWKPNWETIKGTYKVEQRNDWKREKMMVATEEM